MHESVVEQVSPLKPVGCAPNRGPVPRICPLCSRWLELVDVAGQQVHCCAHCSIAWRAGSGSPTASRATSRSGSALFCPDCDDRVLTFMGATDRGEEWRCLGCHGRLVRLGGVAEPPPRKPSRDVEIAGLATEALEIIAEVFLG